MPTRPFYYNPLAGGSGGAGAGGAWELIERREVSVDFSTTQTFAGLDGNTDEIYRAICRFRDNTNPGSSVYEMRPNGDVGGASAQHMRATGGFVNAALDNTYRISVLNGSFIGKIVCCDVIWWAKGIVQTIAFGNQWQSRYHAVTPGAVVDIGGEIWGHRNSVVNITSFDFVATSANGISKGSSIALYKIKAT